MHAKQKKEKIVLDLETKKGFSEVGRQNLDLLGVSVAGIYSYQKDEFKVFPESQIKQLKSYLARAELIIGFNIKGFDYRVLQPYLDFDLNCLDTLDMLEEIQASLGFRLSLDSIATATLEIGKSGTGLDALRYFRQGNMEKLIQYCRHDVFITREVYEHGRKYGHLLYQRREALERIPVNWGEHKNIDQILQEALAEHKTLEIEYSSPNNNAGRRLSRQIDIYAFDLGRIIAYCHLRRALRTFNIRRILTAKLMQKPYQIPTDFNLQEFKAKQKFF